MDSDEDEEDDEDNEEDDEYVFFCIYIGEHALQNII